MNNNIPTQPQSQNQPPPLSQPQKQITQDEYTKLINDFDQNDKLNLTGEQKKNEDDDEQQMQKIKKQYQKFMKQMKEQDDGIQMGNNWNMFENLLNGLNDGDKLGQNIFKKFIGLFSHINNPQTFQKAAQQLLHQFMDGDLLCQPLKQTKQNYESYFKQIESQGKQINSEYKQQYEIIKQLLTVIEQTPNNQPKMIQLFKKLQECGKPPEGITPGFDGF